MTTPRRPTILRAGEGDFYDVVGDRYRLLACKEQTDSTYGFMEARVLPGGGPPPHVHSREEEGFYVLEGEMVFYCDGEKHIAGPGAFVHLPKGTTHRFHNESDAETRMLVIMAPGGMEKMFTEIGIPVSDPNAPIAPVTEGVMQGIMEITPKYGIELKV
ncbi:MAG: quercetin 2,3-dioxygenase [Candidatus Hydrogenedentes bacterium]|nr:quercetin 2,3-dioxygenase [Candidatus Hydrogenedentota bacterium]